MMTRRLRSLSGAIVVVLLSWTSPQAADAPTPAELTEKLGLRPGMTITQENADLLNNLVPEAIVRRTKAGEYVFTIGKLEPPDEFAVALAPYVQKSREHAGKFDIDGDGGVVEKTSGKRPDWMPYGFPFPTLDFGEDPKKLGSKIYWNSLSLLGMMNDFELMSRVGSYPVKGTMDRYFNTFALRQYLDFRSEPIHINRPLSYQEISTFLSPADSYGNATLTWRWTDPKKWDSVWNYSPSVRRVQRLTAANRSDPLLGTEATRDDSNLYNGKVEMMEWKYIGETTMLMPFLRLESQESEDVTVSLVLEGKQASRYPKIANAFETSVLRKGTFAIAENPQRYPSWWVLDMLWIPTKAYVVEAIPKDPYYNYGRQIYWFEATTFVPAWKQVYDRSGEYWKTIFLSNGFVRYQSQGKTHMAFDPTLLMVMDEKANRATYSPRGSLRLAGHSFSAEGGTDNYNFSADPELWTLGRFLEAGK